MRPSVEHRRIERFHDLDWVLREVTRRVVPLLQTELLRPLSAIGRVSAEEVRSPSDRPSHDASHMDGYAVRSSETSGASRQRPVALKVDGFTGPNERGPPLGSNCARRILTGGYLPEGADAVIPQEEVVIEGDYVLVLRPVKPREHVDRTGSDLKRGATVLTRGEVISPVKAALLESLGVRSVSVMTPPVVGVMSFGSELTDDPEKADEGRVLNTHAPMLVSMLSKLPCRPLYLGLVPDYVDAAMSSLKRALDQADMVLTVGGSSVSELDVVPRALVELSEFFVQGLRLQPGRVGGAAVVRGKPVVVLPALVHSTINVLNELGVPVLTHLASAKLNQFFSLSRAVLSEPISFHKWIDFLKVVWVSVSHHSGQLSCRPHVTESSVFSSVAFSDGYLLIEPDVDRVDAGTEVLIKRPLWML